MSSYAILNFEDKIADAHIGAADSTIKALTFRYETTKQNTGLKAKILGRNTVNEYRCVDGPPVVGFTTNALALQNIRQACQGAEKIYLVLHGDPRTTDTAYTNAVGAVGVLALCSSLQLATFLGTVLPNKDKQTIALVMCYGARCKDYRSANVNHQGAMSIGDLKTSYAYRLAYELTQLGFRQTISAVTGKIQHDNTSGRALIEKEELIDVNMELAEAMRTFTQDAAPHGGGVEFKKTVGGKAQLDGIKTLQGQRGIIRGQLGGGDEANKYGKLVFKVKGGKITILNKYGSSTGGGVSAGTVLYKGPLVTPGAA